MVLFTIGLLGFVFSIDWYSAKGLTKPIGFEMSGFNYGGSVWAWNLEVSFWTPFKKPDSLPVPKV
jgi:hypothetical protein